MVFQNICFGQVIWKKHYEDLKMNVLSSQALTNGNAFDLVGIGDYGLYSIGLNNKQEIVNNNIFEKNELKPNCIHTTNGKNYIVVTNFLGSINYALVGLKGNKIWDKTFKTTAKINAICITSDKDLIMVGEKNNRMFVMKLGKDGEIIWEKLLGGQGALLDVELTQENNLLVVGYVDLYFSNETDFMVLELDANGNNKWERAFGEPNTFEKAHLVSITSNGNIVIIGQRNNDIWLLQLNAKKEVEWEELISKEGKIFLPTSICTTKTNQTIFTANVRTVDVNAQKNSYLFIGKMKN